jgi:peptidoglycan hydrolase-like protein with peptidoglycan-binding domain
MAGSIEILRVGGPLTTRSRPAGQVRSQPVTPLLVDLQRSLGNAGVTRLLAQRAPAATIQRCPGCGGTCGCEEDEEKIDELQTLLRTRTAPGGLQRLADPLGGVLEPVDFGTPNGTRPLLQLGSKGAAVGELQSMLNQVSAAAPALATDGDFGPLTHGAVKTFQGSESLVPDGIVGPLTWGSLGDLLGIPGLGTPPGPGPAKPPAAKGQQPLKVAADTDDVEDEQTCAALPASQMGAAVNDILSWQSDADDMTLLNRLAEIICFPAQYQIFVPGIAVALVPPPPGASQRQAMLGKMVQALDDFKFGLEMAKSAAAPAFGLPQLSDARAAKISDRIDALRAIAGSPGSEQISAKRLAAASIAAGEVGKVDHKLLDGGRRYGADRLLEYFNVAFGGSVPASQVKTINNPPANVKDLLSCTLSPSPCDDLAPWCGIFASWALQSAGISLPPWSLTDGKGVNQRGAWRQLGTQPGDEIMPGDLATRTSGNHQALVIVAEPGHIETAEGNTNLGGGTGIAAAVGGKIVHKSYNGKGLNFPAWDTGFFRPPGAD